MLCVALEFIQAPLDGTREKSVSPGELLHAVEAPRGRLEGSRVKPGSGCRAPGSFLCPLEGSSLKWRLAG